MSAEAKRIDSIHKQMRDAARAKDDDALDRLRRELGEYVETIRLNARKMTS